MANITKKVVLEPDALVILSKRFDFLAEDISVSLICDWSFIEEIGQLPLLSGPVLEEPFFSESGEYDGGGGRTGPAPADCTFIVGAAA